MSKPVTYGKPTFKKAHFWVDSFEDYLIRLSAILEVCVLALDGKGDFYSNLLQHKDRHESIRLVLEMAIELIPYEDISKYERMMAIVENDFDHQFFSERIERTFKN